MKKELADRITLVDKALDSFLPIIDKPQMEIYEAMRYSLFAGGKRLRPILMLEAAKLFGKDWEDVCEFACAIEMIHTYSLIHDDLPAMDNDDFRRNKPTNHIVYGEAAAILAGDALLNKAFEITSNISNKSSEAVLRAMRILSEASGTEGMIGGQVVDIKSEGKNISLDELKYIHLLKTGALIKASCVIGAILSDADTHQIDAITRFAENLGIAFQIRDDILDVIGDADSLGKPIGSDIEQEKSTYVSICGLDKAKELVLEYSNKAKEALLVFGDKARFLLMLTDYLINRIN